MVSCLKERYDKAMNAARRITRGELAFDDGVDPPLRETFRAMWIHRFAHFHARDLDEYLWRDVDATRYVSGGKEMTARGFRRRARLLFVLLALLEPLGVTMQAEQLDARITPDDGRYLTHGMQLYMLHGWPFRGGIWLFRQSRMRVWFAAADGTWVWDEAIERPLPKSQWLYRRITGPDGEAVYTRLDEPGITSTSYADGQ